MSTAPAPTRPTLTRWAGANVSDLARRAGSDDYPRWQGHIRAAAGCAHPIRLRGDLHTVEPATGRIVDTTGTAGMPDGVLYVPCGNRRAVVCPSCAETYRADTFQLVKAGLAGGKGVPDTVAAPRACSSPAPHPPSDRSTPTTATAGPADPAATPRRAHTACSWNAATGTPTPTALWVGRCAWTATTMTTKSSGTATPVSCGAAA